MNNRCLASLGVTGSCHGHYRRITCAAADGRSGPDCSTKSRELLRQRRSRGQGKRRRACRICRDIGPTTAIRRLQRDANMTKEFFTKEELAADEKRRAAQQEEQTVPGTTGDVHYDFTQFALDRSQTRLTGNLRTSMIVDPPNGRLPPRVGADAGAAGGRGGGGGWW